MNRMLLQMIKQTMSKHYSSKKLLLTSALIIGFLSSSNVISQQKENSNSKEDYRYSNKSFVTKAVEKTGKSVVTIDTQRYISQSRPPRIFVDPYFREFFGLQMPYDNQPKIEQSQGSGFIFADGLVMTNAHVVNGSDKLIIGLTNGKKLKGKLVGQDFFTDLAVLKLDGKGPWPKAKLGDSTKIKVGDWAIAVGNPFGLENTVTLGIISNLNRDVAQLGISDKRIDLIQTDAAINPGNSGGPLLNSFGEVIGINTLVRTGPGAGLGFAIPINRARKIANDLIKTGRAKHPMIGVTLSSNIKQKSKFLSQRESGAIIKYLTPNGPAEKGGLKIDDLIISINNEIISTPADVVQKINQNDLESNLKIKIIRKGKEYLKIIKPIDIYELKI